MSLTLQRRFPFSSPLLIFKCSHVRKQSWSRAAHKSRSYLLYYFSLNSEHQYWDNSRTSLYIQVQFLTCWFQVRFTNFWFLLWGDVFISNANIYSDSSMIRTRPILLREDQNDVIFVDLGNEIGIIFACKKTRISGIECEGFSWIV